MKKAALFVGGWEGHRPEVFCDWATGLLQGEGFEVQSHETLAPLAQPEQLADLDLLVPIWSSARSSHRPEFGNMTKAEEDGLLQLIAAGCGIAGWHGHTDDPIVRGVDSFRLTSEQYYMLVDPSNHVLATTTFSGEHLWWIEGTTIPVVWKRRWDRGRVFYCSIGHRIEDLQVPQVTEIMRRGMVWAGFA
jgi:type 1 glutamine amidotransferase